MDNSWIKATIHLPEYNERVLICVGSFVGEGYFDGLNWLRYAGYDIEEHLGQVTHWMKLPRSAKGR